MRIRRRDREIPETTPTEHRARTVQPDGRRSGASGGSRPSSVKAWAAEGSTDGRPTGASPQPAEGSDRGRGRRWRDSRPRPCSNEKQARLPTDTARARGRSARPRAGTGADDPPHPPYRQKEPVMRTPTIGGDVTELLNGSKPTTRRTPPGHRHRQPERRSGKDDDHGQPGSGAGRARLPGPGRRSRSPGQRHDRTRRRRPHLRRLRCTTSSCVTTSPRGLHRADQRPQPLRRPRHDRPGRGRDRARAGLQPGAAVAQGHRNRDRRLRLRPHRLPTIAGTSDRQRPGGGDEVLVPIQCEYYALEGLGQLLRNVQLVAANLNVRPRGQHHRPDHVRRPNPIWRWRRSPRGPEPLR